MYIYFNGIDNNIFHVNDKIGTKFNNYNNKLQEINKTKLILNYIKTICEFTYQHCNDYPMLLEYIRPRFRNMENIALLAIGYNSKNI